MVPNRYEHRRRDLDQVMGRLFLNRVRTGKLKGLGPILCAAINAPQTPWKVYYETPRGLIL